MGTPTPSAGPDRRTRYADPGRCPHCSGPLTGPHCGVCDLELVGPVAQQLWSACVELDRWHAERDRLVVLLRRQQEQRRQESTARLAARQRPAGQGAPHAVVPVPRAELPRPATPLRRGLGVQTLLVGVGAVLLAAATVVFLLVSWESLGLAGRSLVVGTGTLAVLAGAGTARRARLDATAEALGGLGVVLVLLDVWAVRATGLVGAQVPGLAYAAAGAAAAAVLLSTWGLLAGVRTGTLAASVLLPAVPVLTGLAVAEAQTGGAAWAATTLGLAAGSAVGALRGLRTRPDLDGERAVLGVVAAVLLGTAAAVAALSRLDAGAGTAAGLLTVVAMVAGGHAVQSRSGVPLTLWSLSAGAITASAAATAVSSLPGEWVPALAPAAAGAVALALRAASGRARRWCGAVTTSARGALGAAGAAGLPAVATWAVSLLVLPAAAVRPWSLSPTDRVGSVLLGATGEPAVASGDALAAALGLVVLSAVGLAWRRSGGGHGVVVAGAGCAVAGAVGLALVPDLALWAATAGLVAVAAACAAAVVPAVRVGEAVPRLLLAGSWFAGAAAVVLGWTAEPLAVPVTLLGAAALLVARLRSPDVGPAHLLGVVVAVLVSAGAAVTSAGGSPTEVLTAVGVAAALALAVAATVPADLLTPQLTGGERRVVLVSGGAAVALAVSVGLSGVLPPMPLVLPVVAMAAVLAVAVDPLHRTGPAERAGGGVGAVVLGVVLAADVARTWGPVDPWLAAAAGVLAALVADALLARAGSSLRGAVETAAVALGGVVVLGAATAAPAVLWLVLAVLAVGAAVVAALPDRRAAGWLALALGTGSLWVRLGQGGVTGVEAYTVLPALALLVVAGVRRVRRDSDPVLVAGAGLLVMPTALASVTGPAWRAVAVLVVGALLVALGAALSRAAVMSRAAALSGAGHVASTGFTVLPVALGVLAVLTGPWVRGLVEAGSALPAAPAAPEAWSLPAAAVVAGAGWVVRTDGRWRAGLGRRSPWPLAGAVVVAALPSLAAVQPGPWATWRALGVLLLGAAACLAAVVLGERVWPPGASAAAGASVAVAATLVGLGPGEVRPPEVLLGPLAVLLLLLGWRHLRRNRRARSVPALAPGLGLLLLPSLVLALAEPVTWRVVGLALVATAVVTAGAVLRWQAPLLAGGAVLVGHAVVQTWPQLVLLYDAVPRWVSLGCAGALLLALGARYERRLRDLRTVRTRVGAMR